MPASSRLKPNHHLRGKAAGAARAETLPNVEVELRLKFLSYIDLAILKRVL